jgi:multicomponent K+:H+ antiporter subunit D
MPWAAHLLIAPILLPLVAGAVLLLFDESRRVLKAAISAAATAALLLVAAILLGAAAAPTTAGAAITRVYLLANWPAPFGIVLVLDRLSALMLVLTAVLALAALVFSLARWDRGGRHFHTLFQLLLMGLDGAFLTGDLFNLFVFFEVMLTASYGLVLHGSGSIRVRAGLHYIVVNLAASSLFLIGVSLIYGAAGTLNMADLATRIPTIAGGDRTLLEAGAAILGVAFLVKAGMWPLSFWLPTTYAAAAAPAAAILAVMSKVGFYVILRLSPLLFGAGAGTSAGFGTSWLLVGGMATIVFGAIGVLASQSMGRLAGFSVLVSSGSLLAAIGLADAAVTSGALYYMVSSTMTIAALFLLIELVERARNPGADVLAVTMEAYGDADEEETVSEVGVVIPGTLAILGVCFGACGLLLAGLPPLSGFVAKFALLAAMFDVGAPAGSGTISTTIWVLATLLILSGFAALIAMTRAGIRTFWAPIDNIVPRVPVVEVAPVAMLLVLCLALAVRGGPVMRYMDATAQALYAPMAYVHGVMAAPRVPTPPAGAPR